MEDIAKAIIKKLTISQSQYDAFKRNYMSLKTDEDRVKTILCLLRKEKILPLLPEPSTKSVTASQGYRKQGTELFITPSSASRLDITIDYYTKSIVFAPPKSTELAIGYANRSAALFAARLYHDSLQDISRALTLPYPDDLKAKLYARRARCLMTLKSPTEDQREELREALKMAAEYLDKMAVDSKGRGMIETMLKEPEKMIPAEPEYTKWQSEALKPKLSDENPEIKGLSSALKLEFNEEFGRHVVATRDISPGEVLAVMKPYAGILDPEKRLTHCGYCMEQTWSSVPCEDCCEVVYCDEGCRNRAYDEHHDVECQVVRHLIALQMTYTSLLSLRLVVKAIKEAGSIQALRQKVKDIEAHEDPRTIGFTEGLLDDNYACAYTQIRNTEKRSFIDLFWSSLNSSYILFALATKSDLFGREFEGKIDGLDGDADMTFVGGLIMRHHQIVSSNAHCIHEAGPQEPLQKGTILMPFSQMNHSCNSGATKIAYGMNMVVYASYATKKGQQVFENYGPSYETSTQAERRKRLLEDYHFFCNCVACTENWPTVSMGLPSARGLPHQTQEQIRNSLRNCLKYYELVASDNFTSKVAAMIADTNNIIKIIQETVGLLCEELVDVHSLRSGILRLTGNRLQSVNFNN